MNAWSGENLDARYAIITLELKTSSTSKPTPSRLSKVAHLKEMHVLAPFQFQCNKIKMGYLCRAISVNIMMLAIVIVMNTSTNMNAEIGVETIVVDIDSSMSNGESNGKA